MRFKDLPKKSLKGLISVYRYVISPLTGGSCRFYPTCSAYALEAIERHGAAKGSVMAGLRICKCHPWHKGEMIDPVPSVIDWGQIIGYKRAKPETTAPCACTNHKTKE